MVGWGGLLGWVGGVGAGARLGVVLPVRELRPGMSEGKGCGQGVRPRGDKQRTDARVEAGDVVVEGCHPVRIAGHDDDEVLLVVLHDVEQDLDGLLVRGCSRVVRGLAGW